MFTPGRQRTSGCVVDPEPRRVIVYTPPNAVAVLGAEDLLDAGALLPGFACRVAELFT